jgi:serine/threonine protein kinase
MNFTKNTSNSNNNQNKEYLCEGRYEVQKKLGEGTYGTVYKCFDTQKNQLVAVKKLKFHFENEGVPATSIREIGILRGLKHQNLVSLKDVSKDYSEKNCIYLSFEMMDMDLNGFIKLRNKQVPVFEIKRIMFEIIKGVNHLHENRIFHRDLKPDNVLIKKDISQVKLADFGLSRTIHQPFRPMSREIMTLWYRSPEACMGYKDYSIGVDCWAVGCIFA